MTQAGISVETSALAERLMQLEAAETVHSEEEIRSTCIVCEKLRHPLSALVGSVGFSSLLGRALTLAKREVHLLSGVQIRADGTIDGLEGEAVQGNATLIAFLLTLLITFIGQPLTMRLLHDVWPNLSISEATSQEGNPN